MVVYEGNKKRTGRILPPPFGATKQPKMGELGEMQTVGGQSGNLNPQGAGPCRRSKQAVTGGYYADADDPILPSQQKSRSAGGVRRSVLSAGYGDSPQTACHRPRKPIHGGAQRFSHCLCAASGQQCQRTAGVCRDGKEKGKSTSQIWLRANPSSKENR